MKKLLILIIALISSIAFTGCKKQLEENPPARFKIENLNKEIAEALVIGAYEPLSRSRGRLWESTLGTNLVKMAEYGKGSAPVDNLDQYKFDLVYNSFAATWITFYTAIGRANMLIKNLEADKNLIEADRNAFRGEAKFIRAVCYYTLVRLYGEVPMRLEPIPGYLDIGTPLSDEATEYAQIIKDLQDAEAVLPPTYPDSKAGRATAGAAKTMLADVYLTMKNYDKAKEKSLEVIANKVLYKYDLVKDLNTLYSPTLATNSEDIFSIKFSQSPNLGSFLPTNAADLNAKAAGFAARGLGTIAVLNTPLITGWDNNDLRRAFNLYNSYTINGVVKPAVIPAPAAYRLGKYKDPGATEETAAGNDYYLYRYADVLLIFAEAENMVNAAPTPAAYDAINNIRRRGYGFDINAPNMASDLPAGLTKQEFDDMVFRERGYEFMFEGKRWFDLKRTGRTEAFITAAGKPAPTSLILSIPDVETDNNPAL